MYKSKKKLAVLCAAIFVALGMWMILSVHCRAAETNNDEKQSQTVGQDEAMQQKIIRVGSFEDTFDYVDENGLRRGYGYELLQTLAGYTGWKFEYVKCDWSNCFDKIENGHIAKSIQVDKLLSILSEIIRQQDQFQLQTQDHREVL